MTVILKIIYWELGASGMSGWFP